MRTNTRVQFGLYDVTARQDSIPSSIAAQPFCDAERDLKMETDAVPTIVKYGTLEKKQFLMDGSFELFPEEPSGLFWGLWSKEQSDETGLFRTPPVLNVAFSKDHSSAGITLHFYGPTGDWASEVLIQWYGEEGQTLATGRFYPDEVDFFCDTKVEGYHRISLQFLSTSRPGRYLKLTGIDYGVSLTFSGQEVVKAHVLEEVDLLSNEVSVNTLNLILFNRQGKFSILNPKGVFDVLQHKQKFTVYEDIRADAKSPKKVTHNMGTFYLSDWENTSDTLAEFSATDAVGLLDSAPFNGGVYDTTVGTLAAEILDGYEYTLEEELKELPARGYLPKKTRRSALQQLAFSIGAVVDCSRSDKINIYRPPTRPSSLITYRRKFQESKVALKPLITGVTVVAHQYTLGNEITQLYKDDLEPGKYEITLSTPACCLEAEGAVIERQGNNFAVIVVEEAGTVVLQGKKYQESQTSVQLRAPNIPANAQDNVLNVDGATLVGPHNAADVAARILDYYARRYEQKFRMIAGEEVLSDMLVVESFGGEKVRGCLERMEFDLTGGYRADVTVIGQRINTTAEAYAGEIRAGERSMI